jgi:hypothetical protein
MAHRNVGFLETRKIVEKWSQPWRSNPVFSSGAESLRRDVECNMRNLLLLKMPRRQRESDNIETSGSSKAPSQLIRWNPRRRQWKMNAGNSRTEIS